MAHTNTDAKRGPFSWLLNVKMLILATVFFLSYLSDVPEAAALGLLVGNTDDGAGDGDGTVLGGEGDGDDGDGTVLGDDGDDGGSGDGSQGDGDGDGDGGDNKDGDEGVPESYDFKAPEGMQIDEAMTESFSPIFKDLGLNNEQAQKLVDAYSEHAKAQAESVDKFYSDMKAEAKAIPAEQVALAKQAVKHFGEDGAAVMNDAFMGNNPKLITLMSKVGKLISEGGFVEGGRSGGELTPEEKAKRMYPTMKSKTEVVMSTLATTRPTLMDWAKTLDPDGNVADIVEILNEENEVLDDMVFKEGNLATGHRLTVRSGLPTPTWRKLYGGVQPSKSRKVQVTDNTGMLEAYAEVDKALADLNGNTAAFRLSEDRAHIEGMSQEMASTLFYGNESTEPEAFTGFAPRFNSTSAESGDNIILGGGSGADNTSIWLVGWGDKGAFGIFPKGSKAGVMSEDKGQVTIENIDGSNGRMEAYRTHYKWDCGLSVADWRYIVRIPNIDISDLTKNAASGADVIDLMTQALELVPSLNGVRPVFYMNRTIRSILRRQIVNKVASSTLTMDTVAGKRVMMFEEVPVRRCDAILNSESLVS